MLKRRAILIPLLVTVVLSGCGGSNDDPVDTTTTKETIDDGGDTTTTTEEEAPAGEVQLQVDGEAISLKVEKCDASTSKLDVEAFTDDGGSAIIVIPESSDFGPSYDTFEPGTKDTLVNVAVDVPGYDVVPEGYSLTLNADLRSGTFTSFNPESISGSFTCA